MRRSIVRQRSWAWGALVLVLSACAGPAHRGVPPHGSPLVASSDGHWSLVGKIAVSDGREGGSGRIVWHQAGEQYDIEIRAPVSRRAWRLQGDAAQATLDGLDDGPRRGADPELLLREAVGWQVPVTALASWVRGTATDAAAVVYDAQDRPRRMLDGGWEIEYRAWTADPPHLPLRIFARQGERKVRLAVERWDDATRR